MPGLDPATRNIAIAGESQNEVARTLNVNQSTISRLWNRFQQTGSSIRPRRPFFGAVLTPFHRRDRVRWCNRLSGWTFRNWRRIWFSDESRFLLQKRNGRTRVYRRRNERFSSYCVQEVDSFGGGSVMMWVAISNDRKTDLVHVPGNLTAVRYILQPHLMHVIDRQKEFFQQDNARPHTARVAMDYHEQNNINVLPWPSKSPDLNPIEHLWDQLDKRVRQRQPPPQTLDQLRQMLQQEWQTIPRNNVRNLIESMPRRCRAVLAASGGHTRF
jgi:transposase